MIDISLKSSGLLWQAPAIEIQDEKDELVEASGSKAEAASTKSTTQ